MKRVLTTPNAPEAHVALATLDSAGIDAVIRGEHMGAIPAGPISQPSVWVRDEDYSDACRVLGVAEDMSQTGNSTPRNSPIRTMLIIATALLVLLLLQRLIS